MADFGGIIRFTYNGNLLRVRTKFEHEPVNFTYTAEDNQDGSFCRYLMPRGPTGDIEFVDSIDGITDASLPWDGIMAGGPYNLAVIEETTGYQHQWARAQFLGRPKIDRLKGNVTGITFQAPVGGYIFTAT